MEQRVSLITLAVADVDASKRFYLDGLGWSPYLDAPGEVVMIQVGQHLVLSLWDAGHFEDEVGSRMRGDGVPPITLAHNVSSNEEVDEILSLAAKIGADPVMPAQEREWGGYSGYFADPDGHLWEAAHAPMFPVSDDGTIEIPG